MPFHMLLETRLASKNLRALLTSVCLVDMIWLVPCYMNLKLFLTFKPLRTNVTDQSHTLVLQVFMTTQSIFSQEAFAADIAFVWKISSVVNNYMVLKFAVVWSTKIAQRTKDLVDFLMCDKHVMLEFSFKTKYLTTSRTCVSFFSVMQFMLSKRVILWRVSFQTYFTFERIFRNCYWRIRSGKDRGQLSGNTKLIHTTQIEIMQKAADKSSKIHIL